MNAYLLVFYFAYLLLTMALPRWRVRRQTGKNAFVIPKDDSAQGFIGKIFALLLVLILAVLAIYALAPHWKTFLLPAAFLEKKAIRWTGLILLHLSLLFIVLAQRQMRQSWRVGFDEKQRTELVTTGLFRYSRNPVFLGMTLTMPGLFLVAPNGLTLAVLFSFFIVLQIQVRLEEEYLLSVHGEAYRSYKENVRRWF